MNILVDKLPTEYEGLKVNTDFRSFILFELLMQDNELTKEQKINLSLNLFYNDYVSDIKKAIDGIIWFYSLGSSEEKKQGRNKKEEKKQIYSFEYDAKYIYSAFISQYGINLNKIDYLHWFEFKSLFDGLNDENRICQIMGYRAVDLNKIKDKDEKNKYLKLKQIWALPDNRSLKEKENDFADSLW